MLPVASTPSAIQTTRPPARAVAPVAASAEAIAGEWQRAPAGRGPSGRRRTPRPEPIDGELVRDLTAIDSYLSAAGEAVETRSGQLLSVYA